MARRRPATTHGLAVVDKPAGVTSHDVVGMLRRRFGERQVGHGGTLDPDATGVLVVAVGMTTRLLRFVEKTQKEYEGEVVLGAETNTLDAAGQVTATYDMTGVTVDDARRLVAEHLTGPIEQIPPMVSAIRVDGKRLHELAREGIEIERQPRPVVVDRFDVWPTDEPPRVADRGRVFGGHVHPLVGGGSRHAARRGSAPARAAPDAGRIVHARRGGRARRLRAVAGGSGGPTHSNGWTSTTPTAALIANGRVLPRWSGSGPWAVFGGERHELLAVYEPSTSTARGRCGHRQTCRRPASTLTRCRRRPSGVGAAAPCQMALRWTRLGSL